MEVIPQMRNYERIRDPIANVFVLFVVDEWC